MKKKQVNDVCITIHYTHALYYHKFMNEHYNIISAGLFNDIYKRREVERNLLLAVLIRMYFSLLQILSKTNHKEQ